MKTYDNHLSKWHFMHGRSTIPELFIVEVANMEGASADSNNEEDNNEDVGNNNLTTESNMDTQESTSMDFQDEDLQDEAMGTMETESRFEDELKHTAMCWILKIKETCKLTQSATDEIIKGVTDFNSYILSKLYDVILKGLRDLDINIDQVPEVAKAYHPDSPFLRPFKDVETDYLQFQYCKKHLGFVVS